MGERESKTQIFQYPSKSLFKLGVTAEPGAVPGLCHPLSRDLSLAVSTSSKVCTGESLPHMPHTPRTPHSLCPISTSHTELWAAQSQNPLERKGRKGP